MNKQNNFSYDELPVPEEKKLLENPDNTQELSLNSPSVGNESKHKIAELSKKFLKLGLGIAISIQAACTNAIDGIMKAPESVVTNTEIIIRSPNDAQLSALDSKKTIKDLIQTKKDKSVLFIDSKDLSKEQLKKIVLDLEQLEQEGEKNVPTMVLRVKKDKKQEVKGWINDLSNEWKSYSRLQKIALGTDDLNDITYTRFDGTYTTYVLPAEEINKAVKANISNRNASMGHFIADYINKTLVKDPEFAKNNQLLVDTTNSSENDMKDIFNAMYSFANTFKDQNQKVPSLMFIDSNFSAHSEKYLSVFQSYKSNLNYVTSETQQSKKSNIMTIVDSMKGTMHYIGGISDGVSKSTTGFSTDYKQTILSGMSVFSKTLPQKDGVQKMSSSLVFPINSKISSLIGKDMHIGIWGNSDLAGNPDRVLKLSFGFANDGKDMKINSAYTSTLPSGDVTSREGQPLQVNGDLSAKSVPDQVSNEISAEKGQQFQSFSVARDVPMGSVFSAKMQVYPDEVTQNKYKYPFANTFTSNQ